MPSERNNDKPGLSLPPLTGSTALLAEITVLEVRIRELEADLARLIAEKCKLAAEAASYLGQLLEVTAERDERWPAIEVPKRGGVHINDETDKVTAILWGDIKRDPEGYGIIAGGPTPAAAIQALKDKIGGGR